MDKIEILKNVGVFLTSASVGAVVTNVVKNTTPDNVGKISKFAIAVGTYVLAEVVADLVAEKFVQNVDDLVSAADQIKDIVNEDWGNAAE